MSEKLDNTTSIEIIKLAKEVKKIRKELKAFRKRDKKRLILMEQLVLNTSPERIVVL